MVVTRSTAADRRRPAAPSGPLTYRRRMERRLLVVASAVVLLGLGLVYAAASSSFADLDAPEAPLHLGALTRAEALIPYLTAFSDPDDRRFAAEQLVDYLQGEDGRRDLPNVGALTRIRIPAAAVAGRDGLSVYADRLAQAQARWTAAGTPPEAQRLALFRFGEVQAMKPRLVVRTPGDYRQAFFFWALLYLVAVYGVHAAWSARGFRGDEVLLPVLHLLTGIGFVLMVGLRDPLRDTLLFADYAGGVVLGALALLGFSLLDYQRTAWRRLAYVPLLLALGLSLVLVLFGSGPAGSDARINLSLAGLTVQPVEVVKVLLVFFFAAYFAGRWELLRSVRLVPPAAQGDGAAPRPWRRLAHGLAARLDVPQLAYVLPLVVAMGVILLFFFLQRDLGPALILACLFLTLYGVARGRWLAALLGLAVVVGVFWISYEMGYPATVAHRIRLWLHPWANTVPYGGNHLAQGFWAMAAGGWAGTGPGLGQPGFVPEAHTDFIWATIAEELGFVGLVAVLALYALLFHRAYRIARLAPSIYTFFLGLGVTLLLAYQLLLITSGVFGLLPLSGVISPLLNAGKSSMVASFALMGILASLSAGEASSPEAAPLRRASRFVLVPVAVGLLAVTLKAASIQLLSPDETLVRAARTLEADGVQRERYNPRLLVAAAQIPRGTIYDRTGLPLATSSRTELAEHAAAFSRLGIDPRATQQQDRYYPLGDLGFHLLGDINTGLNMAAANTAFAEREERAWLRGYENRRELIPLVRYRHRPGHPAVQALLQRERDLHLTVDARLQVRLAEILKRHLRAAGLDRGAAAVIDARTGALLASVTVPFDVDADEEETLLDRPRFGVYPPGSTFKLVTAMAALRADDEAARQTYACRSLPGGGAGADIRGWGRPIRDASGTPHGTIAMGRALTLSCNAYFAQLGTYEVGAAPLFRLLKQFGMDAGLPGEADARQVERLQEALPQSSIGQGPVLARPLSVALVSATIANEGVKPSVHVSRGDSTAAEALQEPLLRPAAARFLAEAMRSVVTQGTGQAAASAVPVAGKTGTAEVAGGRPHAWFTGFAPYGAARPIAFAVIAENGGAGGRLAAQIARDLVAAAADLGIIFQEERP